MTASQAFDTYCTLLIQQMQYDVWVFSQPWLYECLLIPAAAYLVFFLTKWYCLLVPVTLPLTIWTTRRRNSQVMFPGRN